LSTAIESSAARDLAVPAQELRSDRTIPSLGGAPISHSFLVRAGRGAGHWSGVPRADSIQMEEPVGVARVLPRPTGSVERDRFIDTRGGDRNAPGDPGRWHCPSEGRWQ